MQLSWENLPYLQNFFQLNFLFSGLEVSSQTLLAARLGFFIMSIAGLGYLTLKIVIRILDCVYAFLSGLGTLPRSFFLLLILVIPLSPESLGSKWMGYLLLVMALFGLSALGAFALVIWKHGIDQTLRLLAFLRSRKPQEREACDAPLHPVPEDNLVRQPMAPPIKEAL